MSPPFRLELTCLNDGVVFESAQHDELCPQCVDLSPRFHQDGCRCSQHDPSEESREEQDFRFDQTR